MRIDQDRIQAILQAEHSFYGEITNRKDYRWYPGVTNTIAEELTPAMRVLDVGCGNGGILLELSGRFHSGVGIDHDPEHVRLAEDERRAQGIQNVEFRLMDFPSEAVQLQPESFDMLISLRGPVPDTPEGIQAALRLLRPEGLLLCEEIGELHQHEVTETFAFHSHSDRCMRRKDQLRTDLESSGVDVRLAADVFTKWIFPDVYAWLQYQCNIWTWRGVPLPAADDPRIRPVR